MATSNNLNEPPLRVLFTSAEADPFVKIGGLGDVGGAFPQALRSLSPEETFGRPIDVRLVIPFHGVIDPSAYSLRPVGTFPIEHIPDPIEARVFATEMNGLPVYLVSGAPFMRDAPVYSPDARLDGPKFTFFSLAALELARQLDWPPDILHANDWHTALAVYAASLRRGKDRFFQNTATVLTLHNLPFMGIGAEPALAEYRLPAPKGEELPDWARQAPLPLGLLTADRIVTVSPTYAREILTPEFGCGLQDFLATRATAITGILNGIDTVQWDPARDVQSITNFTPDTLANRTLNKTALQAKFSLQEKLQTPLLIFIGRMDPQKGVDLILKSLHLIPDLDWQAIILGTGDPALEAEARQMENDFPDRVRAVVRFDNRLAHMMYAGADILMMPSRYEPCGLTQMIAMRYGCVPVGRATGGLRDTIQDFSESSTSTGFLFEEATVENFIETLRKALYTYSDPHTWQGIQTRGMSQDHSWRRSAISYATVYHNLRIKDENPRSHTRRR